MTDEERKKLRDLVADASPIYGFINRHMQVSVQLVDLIALLDDADKLRGHCSLLEARERQATEMCTWLTGENQRLRDALKLAEHLDGEIDSLLEQGEEDVVEVAHLQQQLAAMTAARDEARAEVEAADARMLGVLDGTFSIGDGTAQREIERLREQLAAMTREIDEAQGNRLNERVCSSCDARWPAGASATCPHCGNGPRGDARLSVVGRDDTSKVGSHD